MLKSLKIENFKAWQEAELTFGKVTGFFGTNSAGKSSLLQFLLLLKQTRNATDRGLVLDFGGPGDLVNLGTFADVVHRQLVRRKMSWTLDWTLPETLKIRDPFDRRRMLFSGDSLETRCEIGLKKGRLWPFRMEYLFGGTKFSLQPRSKSNKKSNNEEFDLTTCDGDFQLKRIVGRPRPLPPPIKTHLFPDQVKSYFQNSGFLGDFELEYEWLMDSLYYLGPLREHPRREYHWAGSSPEGVGQRGERTMDAILAATRDKRTLKPPIPTRGASKELWSFQKMIAYWLKKLELIESFELSEIAKGTNLYHAMVKSPSSKVETALTDVGFGVSQVLPALVLLYYVAEGSTVLMEQPELHLHPAVQSGLADVMIDVAAARNVQIIVESHSEHLMRRLQRRVAEQRADSKDVKLYVVSSQEGQARISDLVLNEWGEIENWPDKFFGDEMDEIGAIVEAGVKRKMGR